MSRQATRRRKTAETDVAISLSLEGQGSSLIDTGVGFFDHMLTLMTMQAGFDLEVRSTGDLDVDSHHTVEDVGIVLGDCLREALGDRAGVNRYGVAYVPMDEALVRAALDLSGRSYCAYQVSVRAKRLGALDTELVEDFWRAFAGHAALTLHVDMIRGRNSHHIVEAVFKSVGRALGDAAALSGRTGVPSTKGTLSE